jgi:metal-dependent amidase/aminoacylase/carboxypeptidase family protein
MLGNGNEGRQPALHSPDYDFNDALLMTGPAMFGRLVERFLAPA